MTSTPWLIRQPGGPRRLRLYCFSYAGGNATSFMSWQAALDPAIEVCAVQLPGRGVRLSEQPHNSLTGLIEALANVIGCQSKLPFAFFGHSLGGLVAFELARYCKRHYLPMPEHLFVSGCDAPQFRSPSRRLHELEDDALIDVLKNYNGTPPEVLENRELMALVLPAIRADFALVADYQYRPSLPLKIPVTVLAGKLDDHVLSEQIEGWQKETTNTCRIHWFVGDHFFINSNRDAVIDCLSAELAELQCV